MKGGSTGKMMRKYDEFRKKAEMLGAGKAKIIRSASVVTADWIRWRCRYGCDMFGTRLTCPPDSPGPAETKKLLAGYKYGMLIQARNCREIRRIAPILEREIFLRGFYKAFALAAGPCSLCRSCAAACRHPGKARPAMEACGIDVFATVTRSGLHLEVLRTKAFKADCYGLVLIE